MTQHDWQQKWGNEREFRRHNNEILALNMGMICLPLFLMVACCTCQGTKNKTSSCHNCTDKHMITTQEQTTKTADKTTKSNTTCFCHLQEQIDTLKAQQKLQHTK